MAFTECDEYLKMISEPSSFWEWKTLHHRTSGRRPIRKQPRWWRHPSVFKSFAAKKSLHLTAWLDLKKLGHRSQEKSLKSMEYTRWAWSQFIDYVQSAPICSLDGHKFGIWLKRFHWPSCSRLPQSLDRKFWMMKFYWFFRGFKRNWPKQNGCVSQLWREHYVTKTFPLDGFSCIRYGPTFQSKCISVSSSKRFANLLRWFNFNLKEKQIFRRRN